MYCHFKVVDAILKIFPDVYHNRKPLKNLFLEYFSRILTRLVKCRLNAIGDLCKCDLTSRVMIDDMSKHTFLESVVIFHGWNDPAPPPPHSVLFRVRVCLYPLFEKTPIWALPTFPNPPFAGFSRAFPALETPLNPERCSMYPPISGHADTPPPPPPLISDKLSLLVGTSSSSSSSSWSFWSTILFRASILHHITDTDNMKGLASQI